MTDRLYNKRVAVCIDTRDGAGRRRLSGVAKYAQQHKWRMMLVRRRGEKAVKEVQKLQPHGIIAYITDPLLVEAAYRLSVPLIDTAISEDKVSLSVSLDNSEVGSLAADSLTRLGLKNFAYCGVRKKCASSERHREFARHLKSKNFELYSFSQNIAEGESKMGPLIAWLASLPKPVGILTFDDKLGERVLTACHWSDLAVPDKVAILGVGNDDLISRLTFPPLSSIDVPAEEIGFEASRILQHAMEGKPVNQAKKKISPLGVTMRGTTTLVALEDSLVKASISYILKHAGEAIGVEHIARANNVSRRTLDRRFIKTLGRSVHDELSSIRMINARLLLTESQDSVAEISRACGYLTAASFSRAFHQQTGFSPVGYRKRIRR